MATVSKKICMVGDFGVGKTSTVSQYVNQVFSEKYQTTVGVKIDTKEVSVDQDIVKMVLWDIAGTDNLKQISLNYLRGASAYLLVVDGTRAETLETALSLKQQIDEENGELPFVLLLNKVDLKDQWDIPESQFEGLKARGWKVEKTSALSGEGIEDIFQHLAKTLRG